MEEFRVCPECDHEKGFQIFFKKVKGKIKIDLICPNCGQSYDLGWSTTSIKSFKLKKGLIY
jgi:transcription elongation factor Elf1